MTALAAVLAGALGLGAGFAVQRAAARFAPAPELVPAGGPDDGAAPGRSVSLRVPAALPVVATTALCALAGARFGLGWELPAFVSLAVVGVLLAVIDLEHRVLPNRILLPATAVGALLLTLAAALDDAWPRLAGAVAGGAVLFVLFLVLALLAPAGLGMGDVKLAGLLGLYLGWLGWAVLVAGTVAGFVVQAVVAVGLLAGRRIGVKGEIPFGPALLGGAVLAIGWGAPLVATFWGVGR
jgi:leader peptidase (prepilin peptidase)/N-methyltransferase